MNTTNRSKTLQMKKIPFKYPSIRKMTIARCSFTWGCTFCFWASPRKRLMVSRQVLITVWASLSIWSLSASVIGDEWPPSRLERIAIILWLMWMREWVNLAPDSQTETERQADKGREGQSVLKLISHRVTCGNWYTIVRRHTVEVMHTFLHWHNLFCVEEENLSVWWCCWSVTKQG